MWFRHYPYEIRHQKEIYRRAFEDVERIIRNGNDRSLIVSTVHRPRKGGPIFMGFKRIPCLPLRKTGWIDAYCVNSAMSLYLMYRELQRTKSLTFPRTAFTCYRTVVDDNEVR